MLASGGTVTNAVTGTITSAIREGVQISGAPGTVDNLGTITSGTIGVFLDRGGSLTNRAGATIDAGTIGTRIDNGGVLMNLAGGMIVGNGGNGAEMRNGGTVINDAGALISGTNQRRVHVTGGGGGTLTNEWRHHGQRKVRYLFSIAVARSPTPRARRSSGLGLRRHSCQQRQHRYHQCRYDLPAAVPPRSGSAIRR